MIKKDLRLKYLELRKTISPKELEIISENICNLIFSNFQVEKKRISIFLPIKRSKEINTYKILDKAISLNAEVSIPKINNKNNELKHVIFESKNQLEINKFGIPEPIKGKITAAEHFDYVFIPLLTIDFNGNRIGYGKGYYDRFLKRCKPRCKFIGLYHFDELTEKISDINTLDVKLHACITPNKIIHFK
ncbi:MAG: 5-formyltetrahydrofolate cyclo-ligase [Crocinitomicaceae bacterium]|nr:5-formyltetrahydrofolate cyclo-ligase [Crocinitomicaceae bacterium]|tara:strand:- start:365 stop:934 length:570 start_codon:yes stop_codon:yes gene_type:complete